MATISSEANQIFDIFPVFTPRYGVFAVNKGDVVSHDGRRFVVVGCDLAGKLYKVCCAPERLLLDADATVFSIRKKIIRLNIDYVAEQIYDQKAVQDARVHHYFWKPFNGKNSTAPPRELMVCVSNTGDSPTWARVTVVDYFYIRRPHVLKLKNVENNADLECNFDLGCFKEVNANAD